MGSGVYPGRIGQRNRSEWTAAGALASSERGLKRFIDILGGATGLLLSAPILAVAAVLIKLESSGPVIYRSRRIGLNGIPFTCYKLRSMVPDADEIKDNLLHLNQRKGATFKIARDPRMTRLGALLRKFSLDELPQFYNVLVGDMSLVGPRPHPEDDVKRYAPEHFERLILKPGLTGLWQVTARRDPSFERNLELDREYIDNWSLGLDLKILLMTIPAVVRGDGQ
ncbi:MAG TPA: sugar transferase [Terriglobales bacterium]|nr:sugar transferase [Terriglobales bacterium]